MKLVKLTKIVSVIVLIALVFSSCFGSKNADDYCGDYPELYSIAIHSLLGSTGYDFSERKFDSEVTVIKEDNYGRKIFLYFENNIVSTYSIIISQKVDDNYSYFYPDYNFISAADNDFLEEAIEELKRKNDWDMPINTGKCVKVEIVRKKSGGPVNSGTLLELYSKTLGDDAFYHLSYIEFFTIDNYDRSIYFGFGKSERYVVMLFKPDGTYDESKCVMELTDLYSYQDELKEFKDLNDWNKPI